MAVRGVAPGKYVTRLAPSGGVVAGTAVKIGAEVVIPTTSVDADVDFVGIIGPEVVYHAKVSAQSWSQGAKLYFDAATGLMTTTSGGNTYVGTADREAANPSDFGYIRLHGTPP